VCTESLVTNSRTKQRVITIVPTQDRHAVLIQTGPDCVHLADGPRFWIWPVICSPRLEGHKVLQRYLVTMLLFRVQNPGPKDEHIAVVHGIVAPMFWLRTGDLCQVYPVVVSSSQGKSRPIRRALKPFLRTG
jgi:hypothetical protein